VVRSFELDDRDAVVRAVARIAKYLVGKEKQRSVKADTSWFDRVGSDDTQEAVGDTPPAIARRPQLRLVKPTAEERYVNCVPFVPLQAAAGAFSDPQHIEDGDFEWAKVDSRHRLSPGMFVAQVVGKSMEPVIPDGAFCLFRAPVGGTRQGKTVLVELRDAADPETGQRFTVKRYESEKGAEDESWRHVKITLRPVNPDFEPIVLTGDDDSALQVIAEFVEVLGSTD
jgi:SOS-response transcriptional repressor LexA